MQVQCTEKPFIQWCDEKEKEEEEEEEKIT